MERAKRRHIQKCVKECSAEQIMNRLFKIFWDTVKEGHDPTAFSQKAWGSCTTYTACYSVVLVVFTLCSCTSADRVKSVIKSGEERNVIDPDGGVHERRKLEELQKAGSIDYAAFPQLKPRPVLDESKWSTQLLYSALHKLTLERIYEYVGANVSSKCGEVTSTKPGALRSLMCGYRLHAAGHVQSPEYNSGPDLFSCYFRVNVKPAMKTTETYVVVVKLNRGFGHVMSTMCTCKAG